MVGCWRGGDEWARRGLDQFWVNEVMSRGRESFTFRLYYTRALHSSQELRIDLVQVRPWGVESAGDPLFFPLLSPFANDWRATSDTAVAAIHNLTDIRAKI